MLRKKWEPTIWLQLPCKGCNRNMWPGGYQTRNDGRDDNGIKKITVWCEECWNAGKADRLHKVTSA